MASDPVIVSATEGPMPPTIERLQALRASGATSVDYVVTDCGLVDAELLELVELELRDLAQQHGLEVASLTRDASGESGPSGIYGPPS